MREQKLTVLGLFRPGWHGFPESQRVPLLQLSGSWLEELDFHVGAEVRVQAEAGRLVVVLRGLEGEERSPC